MYFVTYLSSRPPLGSISAKLLNNSNTNNLLLPRHFHALWHSDWDPNLAMD